MTLWPDTRTLYCFAFCSAANHWIQHQGKSPRPLPRPLHALFPAAGLICYQARAFSCVHISEQPSRSAVQATSNVFDPFRNFAEEAAASGNVAAFRQPKRPPVLCLAAWKDATLLMVHTCCCRCGRHRPQ